VSSPGKIKHSFYETKQEISVFSLDFLRREEGHAIAPIVGSVGSNLRLMPSSSSQLMAS
jgi:hypothetical protein